MKEPETPVVIAVDKSKLASPSCQTCIKEMALFCRGCPHINRTDLPDIDIESLITDKYRYTKSSDYRNLNEAYDELICAVRRFETEIARTKEESK